MSTSGGDAFSVAGSSGEGPVRAAAMAERVLRTARWAGTPANALPMLERAHALAMAPRLSGLDPHETDFLHPGRSALILLLDAKERASGTLAAALLAESERAVFRFDPERVAAELGGEAGAEVARLLSGVPPADAPDLAERLLLAGADAQRVALAERLDHLRHAHLWPDPVRRRAAHETAYRVYAEIARRVHPTLARRYDWWCSMFAARHLG